MGKLITVEKKLDVFSLQINAGIIEYRLSSKMIDGFNKTVDKKLAISSNDDDIIFAPLNFGVTSEDDSTLVLSSSKIPCFTEISELPLNKAGENKIFTYNDLIRKIRAQYGVQKIPENKLPDIKAFFRGLKFFCLIKGHSFSVKVTKNGGFSVKLNDTPFDKIPFTCVYKTYTQAQKELAERKDKFTLDNAEYLKSKFKAELSAELNGARLSIETAYTQLQEKTRLLNADIQNKHLEYETAVDKRRQEIQAEIQAMELTKNATQSEIDNMKKSASERHANLSPAQIIQAGEKIAVTKKSREKIVKNNNKKTV